MLTPLRKHPKQNPDRGLGYTCAVSPLDTQTERPYSRAMALRGENLQLIRRERHPLVALATLAFTLRLCLVILASALAPEFAAATGLTKLCQSSGQQQSLAFHDPAVCQCGPACVHGCSIAPAAPTGLSVLSANDLAASGTFLEAGRETRTALSGRVTAIRAPPHSLI
ncbi:MAG: hypothetical protein RDA78_28860 [Roseibium sp.]|uniref:hypothetical protein n=1 Tax=Roseibium sp. TaxID=1936156 RepID=UPI003D9C3309